MFPKHGGRPYKCSRSISAHWFRSSSLCKNDSTRFIECELEDQTPGYFIIFRTFSNSSMGFHSWLIDSNYQKFWRQNDREQDIKQQQPQIIIQVNNPPLKIWCATCLLFSQHRKVYKTDYYFSISWKVLLMVYLYVGKTKNWLEWAWKESYRLVLSMRFSNTLLLMFPFHLESLSMSKCMNCMTFN